MLSKQSKTMKSMKRTIFTLLATVMMTVGAGAQEAELAEFKSTNLWLLDSVKVDSMYNYWDAYVQAHPKEELARCAATKNTGCELRTGRKVLPCMANECCLCWNA